MHNKTLRYLCFVPLFVLMAIGRGLTQTLPEPLTQVERPPCYHDEFSTFAFLEGEWEVRLDTRLADGKWEATTAASQIKHDLDGCILVERFTGSREHRPFHVLSIFAFDNNSKRLQYLLSDSGHGLLALYQGEKVGSDILLDLEFTRDDGSKVTVRRAYSEIQKNSFTLESKHSRDGGKSWATVMTAHYKRKTGGD